MSDAFNPQQILGPFQQLKDPRSSPAGRHVFEEMLILALAATLAGAKAFTDMERFGNDKLAFSRTSSRCLTVFLRTMLLATFLNC
jgi:DDE_Tnp_1-associated